MFNSADKRSCSTVTQASAQSRAAVTRFVARSKTARCSPLHPFRLTPPFRILRLEP